MVHQNGQLDSERLVWSIERINAAVDRLAVLTKDVLDLSRLRGGHFPFRPRAADLVDVLRHLEPRIVELVGERLVLDLTDQGCPVLVDQDRLDQILMNLVDNAVKYSPPGGPITVQLERETDGAVLSVTDDGVGLPEGSNELIFEAFGRASNAERWNVPGMGLGLHICRLMVERHGGRMWAESEGEDRGTRVNVWLPLAAESPMTVSDDATQRLSNQLTLAVGYCELLASTPDLPPQLRAQALDVMQSLHTGYVTPLHTPD